MTPRWEELDHRGQVERLAWRLKMAQLNDPPIERLAKIFRAQRFGEFGDVTIEEYERYTPCETFEEFLGHNGCAQYEEVLR